LVHPYSTVHLSKLNTEKHTLGIRTRDYIKYLYTMATGLLRELTLTSYSPEKSQAVNMVPR
jgi:hypothetical protein